jgi:outer membrane protein assembly factor BamE
MMRAYYDPDGGMSLADRPAEELSSSRSVFTLMPRETRKPFLVVVLLAALLGASGCVYRANISQGNIVEEEDLDQVELEMTRNQVRFLLGTPMVDDPFHADRWDYVYYIKIGRNRASAKRWVSIFFENDAVVEIRREQELNPDL